MRFNRSLGNPNTFPLTRNRTLTFSGSTLILSSNLHGQTVWDCNNITVTSVKGEKRVVKIHSGLGKSGVQKELKFRSTNACEEFKSRWESEVSRRANEDFIMICVYGCIGLRKRDREEGDNVTVNRKEVIEADEPTKGMRLRQMGGKKNKKAQQGSKVQTPSPSPSVPTTPTTKKVRKRDKFNPFKNPSITTPTATSTEVDNRSPSLALQSTISDTLPSMSPSSSPFARSTQPKGPDTYVVVRWGTPPSHGTKSVTLETVGGEWVTDVIPDNRNPIWTGIGGGEIILHRSSSNVDGNDVVVMVYDEVGMVGSVNVGTDTGGGRVVHGLGENSERGGIAVEVKVPSEQEMEDGRRTRQWKLDHASATTKVLKRMEKETVGILKTMISTASPMPNNRWSKAKGEREFKIKPWLQDKAVAGRDENVWWTKAELKDSIYHPTSKFFPTASSAALEAANVILKVEVLHCVNLPNADGGAVGTMLGKKTDAFVSIVCGETFAKTACINNCLSPIWPPFTKRGFLFPLKSTSRVIHIGVFDSDEGDITGGLSNDFIAKATVDLSRLQSGVEYTTEHKLLNSTTYTTRERIGKRDNGSITVRYSISYNDHGGPRAAMMFDLAALVARGYPEPQVNLHCDSQADHEMIRDTIHGTYRGSSYSLKTLYAMADEAEELKIILFLAFKVITHIVFWSNPLHSAICVTCCYMTASNFDLIPAFICLLLFATLLSGNLYLQRSVTPWRRPRTFMQCLSILLLNRDDHFPNPTIEPNDHARAQEEQDKEWEKEAREFWVMVYKAIANYNRANEEHEKMLEGIGAANDTEEDDGEMVTKNRFGVLDPVGLVLAPVQSALVPPFVIFRVVKNLAICADANMWFILTFTLLVSAITLALIPWGLILRFVFRVLVVLLLGPQNKFLKDKISNICAEFFLYSNDPERAISEAAMRKKLRAVLDVRIQQEREARARDFKILYHGNRINTLWKFNVERFNDPPCIEGSSAVPPAPPDYKMFEKKLGKASRNLMAGLGHDDEPDIREY